MPPLTVLFISDSSFLPSIYSLYISKASPQPIPSQPAQPEQLSPPSDRRTISSRWARVVFLIRYLSFLSIKKPSFRFKANRNGRLLFIFQTRLKSALAESFASALYARYSASENFSSRLIFPKMPFERKLSEMKFMPYFINFAPGNSSCV